MAARGTIDLLVEAGLLDGIASRVAARTGASIALVSLIDGPAQRFAGAHGLHEDDGSIRRATPIALSLCDEVRRSRMERSWTDLRHSELALHGAVTELGIVAYLGMPVRRADGLAIGAVCAAERRPRSWSEHDRGAVAMAVMLAEQELSARGF